MLAPLAWFLPVSVFAVLSLAPLACGGSVHETGAIDAGAEATAGDGPTTPEGDGSTIGDDSASDASDADAERVPCVLEESTTLPHVHIHFTSTQCVFTLAQAAAKITFQYDLIVDQDVPEFAPASPYWYGSSAANLVLGEKVSGGTQSYCVCDQGLPYPQCPEDDGGLTPDPNGPSGACPPVTIRAGTYPRTFTWDGRNWGGPSDTANPEGAPFPAGDYELDVTTAPGALGDAGSLSAVGRFRVRLVP